MSEKKGRGGARPNAGRKKSDARKDAEILARGYYAKSAKKLTTPDLIKDALSILPLEVILRAMRTETHIQEEKDVEDQDWRKAVAYASMAAPYVHAKLATVEVSNDKIKPADEILQELDGRTRGLPSIPADYRTVN